MLKEFVHSARMLETRSYMDTQTLSVLLRKLADHVINEGREGLIDSGRQKEEQSIIERSVHHAVLLIASTGATRALDEELISKKVIESLQRRSGGDSALEFQKLRNILSTSSGGNKLGSLLEMLRVIGQERESELAQGLGNQLSRRGEYLLGASSEEKPAIGLHQHNSSSGDSNIVYNGGLVNGGSRIQARVGASLAQQADRTSINPVAETATLGQLGSLREEPDLGEIPKAAAFDCNSTVEGQLVRDVLYASQGIDGELIKYDASRQEFNVEGSVEILPPLRVQAARLCELGYLYRLVHSYIAECLKQPPGQVIGLVGQAFCSALQAELAEYYHLLAVLEGKAHQPILPHKIQPDFPADQPPHSSYLSLSRLALLLAEPCSRMRILAAAVDHCRRLKGGALLSALHRQLRHGDPLQRAIITRLLQSCCAPLMDVVQRWIFQGELRDPHGEFFVAGVAGSKDDDLWRLGYRLEAEMLPAFISPNLGMSILRAGKSINFLRRCCQDQQWSRSVQVAPPLVNAAQRELGQGRTRALAHLVEIASRNFDGHLIKVIMEKYRFMEHCLAIKRYLLLAQGDFIQYMMDRVGSELNRPAKLVSAFQLTSTLVAALSRSNAQYDDSDIQQRLQVKMMPAGPRDRGWHVFTLEYVVNAPLSAVFTEEAMEQYRHVFNFLWRLKRVEHSLNETWSLLKELDRVLSQNRLGSRGPRLSLRKSMRARGGSLLGSSRRPSSGGPGIEEEQDAGSGRGLGGAESLKEGNEGESGEVGSGTAEEMLAEVVQKCFAERKKMDHFVSNLQSYIMLEAVEGSWALFQAAAQAAGGLDELIAAHDAYLKAVTEKTLLGPNSEPLLGSLQGIFEAILSVRGSCSRLQTHVQQLLARKEEVIKRAAMRTAAGQWGSTSADGPEPQLSKSLLVSFTREVQVSTSQFSQNVKEFIAKLPVEDDAGLHFLSYRLDFSQFYTRERLSRS